VTGTATHWQSYAEVAAAAATRRGDSTFTRMMRPSATLPTGVESGRGAVISTFSQRLLPAANSGSQIGTGYNDGEVVANSTLIQRLLPAADSGSRIGTGYGSGGMATDSNLT